jgi:hypothetical protein
VHPISVIAVTVAVLALLVWTLLPIGAGRSSLPAPTVASLVRRTERRPVAFRLIRTFAVLRRPEPSTAPAMSRGVAVSMLSRGAFLLNLARARFVAIGGQGFWIVPGSRGVCVVAPPHAAALGCALAGGPASADRGLAATAHSGQQPLVYGLAANGSRSVSIVLASGEDVRAPVRRNVYVAALRSAGDVVVVRTKAGRLVQAR